MKLSKIFLTRQLLWLITVSSSISIVAITSTIIALYFLALQQHGKLLTDSVHNQVTLMKTMQLLEEKEIQKDENAEGRLILNAIKHMRQMNREANLIGNSSEFVVAKLQGDRIVFLLMGENYDHEHAMDPAHEDFSLRLDSNLAEAMRLALSGKSGVVTGLDHHAEKVLAAYQYMPEYKLGIVAKVNTAELLSPYLMVILITSSVAVILVFAGAYSFQYSIKRFYASQDVKAENLRQQHEIMSALVEREEPDPCDFQSTFEGITQAACAGLNVDRAGIWLFNDSLSQLYCADLFDRASGLHPDAPMMELTGFPVYFAALQHSRIIDAVDVRQDPRTREMLVAYLQPNAIQSRLDVSIQLDGELLGVVCNEHRGVNREWSYEDQNFARSIADYIALSVSQCRRNKVEQRLKESEQRYNLAVAGSNDGLWDWDIESNKVYLSAQFKNLLGYENKESTEDFQMLFKDLHPDDQQRVQEAFRNHLDNPEARYDSEFRMFTRAGHYRWFRSRGVALRDESGHAYRVSGSITDITYLKEIQTDLHRFKLTLNELTDKLFMFEPETLRFFYVNKSAMECTGYTEKEILGLTLLDIDLGLSEDEIRRILSQVIASPDEAFSFEALLQNKGGEQIPVEIRLQFITPESAPARFVAILRDISERNRAAEENLLQQTILEHIYSLQEDFISGVNRQQVFKRLLKAVLEISESEYGFIGEVLYPEDQSPFIRTRHISAEGFSEDMLRYYQQSGETLEFKAPNTLLSAVISSGEALVSNDPAHDPRAAGVPEGHPALNSFLGIPLKLGQQLTGIIGLANRKQGYSKSVLKRLQPLISTCANLIEAERTELLSDEMQQAFRSSEDKASTILATVAEGIITVDSQGIIESFNLAAEKIFSYQAQEVIGENIKILMPESYHAAFDSFIEYHQDSTKIGVIGNVQEVEGRRQDGFVFPMELSISVMHADENRRFTGIVRDISERKQNEQALIAARDEAEQASRAKSEFLSSMSHELRTPLNAIMGFAQLLELDQTLSGAQYKQAVEIYNAGKLLLELINDVLDFSKIEAGHIDIAIDPVRLEQVLKETCRLIEPQARKKSIALSYRNHSSEDRACNDVWVLADYTRLKQVLLNIINNAIKYNKPEGHVEISCSAAPQGYHRICITDSGSGIQQHDLPNLFQPFNRLGAENSEIEGTGIGLVITQKLVQLMHGSISVKSEPGKGSSFYIDLPIAEQSVLPVKDSTTAKNAKLETTAIKKHYRILVAEDNPVNQDLLEIQLRTLGYSADIVANGKQALEILQKHDYDLLLTDINMPEMDGYQLTQAIRDSSDSRLDELLIIAITANAAATEATRCLKMGMNDYLSKPVDLNSLQLTLKKWLVNDAIDPKGLACVDDALAREKEPTVEADRDGYATGWVIDTTALENYVGSDPAKQRHFFQLFVDTTPGIILSVQQAQQMHSCDQVRDACHKLKSSSRAIGAIRMATLCQQLETASTSQDWKLMDQIIPKVSQAFADVERYVSLQQLSQHKNDILFGFDDAMIVDDDPFVLDLISSRLNNVGITRLIRAVSGEQALSMIKNLPQPPSVLLLDLNMPEMDGVELLRHLAALDYQGDIILISGEDTRLLRSVENIARDRNLNILGALEKPVTIQPLTDLLLRVGEKKTPRPQCSQLSISLEEFREALEKDQLVVFYQPQINLQSGQLYGVEALVRWQHPLRGMIPPDAFIGAAEEMNLINEMTDIIIRKSMQQCQHWLTAGLDVNLSINLSVDSLDRLDLPEYIVKCAKNTGMDVARIMLEITESRLMQDITAALDILTRLSLKGIGLSIDDFGTGYSSMEQLQRIPFTELKIDRAFVNGACANSSARAIVESSVQLAKKLNMSIVAEGVETQQDLSLVTSLGCTFAQGYFIARPMPGAELIEWHQEWKRKQIEKGPALSTT
ncbi:MAG: EAL domain-containing protein [Gammaproteobacteria bacterium]|nr:EAL domain-containing protein [Gammaproteobacteria bacterium]